MAQEETRRAPHAAVLWARRLRLPPWAWPLLALPVVAVVGVWTYRAISKEVHDRLRASLTTMVASDAAALTQWLEGQAAVADLMAADPRVRTDVEALIALAHRSGGDPAALKAAPEQAALRAVFAPVLRRQSTAGFFVIDPGGLIVARVVDERIGERVVLTVADAAARALAGQRVFLPPTRKQRFAATPMAFILVPLRDAAGRSVAVLAFRIEPERMAAVLNAATLGATGETYAVDAEGRMVTESRHAPQLAELGLLPPDAGGHTASYLDVRDPGGVLAAGSGAAPSLARPLTWAAADVVSGRPGVNAEGYRDYRGIPVVGAWKPLPDWGIGVVTELERQEAYETVEVVHRAFRVLGLGLVLAAAAIAFASRRMYGLQKEVTRAHRLGQYTLEEKIGQGGMGAVYRARHAFLRRPTAIKLISGEAKPKVIARFEREVQLTSQLTHPNTIAVYDYGHTPEGVFYYAMEYLPGLPLDRVIAEDGAQPEARVVHLVKQICASLAEAHRIGLVHRDVKPGNVMLCERGGTHDVVKVLDFGLVKDLGTSGAEVTGDDVVVGTPLYMAPEAVTSGLTVTSRADVYAVGAVAYALVTGHQVFAGSSSVEIVGHHLHTRPVSPSERLGRPVSPFLEDLILTCLAKEPALRPADAGALLERLEEGWTGPAWTQREARAWWTARAPSLLARRRAEEQVISRGPRLDVDVDSRMRSDSPTETRAPLRQES